MRRISLVGALVWALSSAGALAGAAPALALPEFSGPTPVPFNGTSGPTTIETVGKMQIQCVADNVIGELTSPTGGSIKLNLTGCELVLAGGKVPCRSPNGAPEEINFAGVAGLGYITHTPTKAVVGVDISNPTGAPLAEFSCGEIRGVIEGSVIGKITPINKEVKPGQHFTLAFSQAKGKQKPTKLEGEPPDTLSESFGGPFEPAGLKSKELLVFPVPEKILA